jgi:hypothetical protein
MSLLRNGENMNDPRLGHVYVINCGDVIKIGRSTVPDVRVQAIGAQSGRDVHGSVVSLAHVGFEQTEKALHQYFQEKRCGGEWFSVCFEDAVQKMNDLLSGAVNAREMASNITPFGLRLQPDLKQWLKERADSNKRSLNGEIELRLEESRRREMERLVAA